MQNLCAHAAAWAVTLWLFVRGGLLLSGVTDFVALYGTFGLIKWSPTYWRPAKLLIRNNSADGAGYYFFSGFHELLILPFVVHEFEIKQINLRLLGLKSYI